MLTTKYSIMTLQFLLHSKTEPEWNGSDQETDQAFQLLLDCVVDKREKIQKQAIKSICILLQNKKIEKLNKPLLTLQNFVINIFNSQDILTNSTATNRVILALNFLSAALQLLPLSYCCDISIAILRLANYEDTYIKTSSYLTLEMLFASRRFDNFIDHTESMLKQLLENQEVISIFKGHVEGEGMRVVAYIQATTQVMLNFATTKHVSANDVLKMLV